MANEEHLAILRQGLAAWDAWRRSHQTVNPDLSCADLEGIDLAGAYLRDTNLDGANLADIDLRGADFTYASLEKANLAHAYLAGADLADAHLAGANLEGANLTRADLAYATLAGASLVDACLLDTIFAHADLTDADLTGANLRDANLESANLTRARLCDTDLQQARLVDSGLDGADLTGAKLWDTQRRGWRIKGVVCQGAFWDRSGKELTEYSEGEFERLFDEYPRLLHYRGGMLPRELAMLPLIIARLEEQHPGCRLRVHSVQAVDGGTTATIAVDDLVGRDAWALTAEVESLRRDLLTLQCHLSQEQGSRLEFEARYQALVQDVLPMLRSQR